MLLEHPAAPPRSASKSSFVWAAHEVENLPRRILPSEVLDREADRDRLLIQRIGSLGGMGLPGLGTRLGPEHVFHAGEVQEVAIGRGVDEERRLDQRVSPRR